MLNSLYGQHEILSIAVADLALPKIGLDSLVLMASNSISFKPDFLNRVSNFCYFTLLLEYYYFSWFLGSHEYHSRFSGLFSCRFYDVSM